MKKIMLMIVAVVMTMFCVFSVAGCNQDPTQDPTMKSRIQTKARYNLRFVRIQ